MNDEKRNTRNNQETPADSTWISFLLILHNQAQWWSIWGAEIMMSVYLQRLVLSSALSEQKPANILQDETPGQCREDNLLSNGNETNGHLLSRQGTSTHTSLSEQKWTQSQPVFLTLLFNIVLDVLTRTMKQ